MGIPASHTSAKGAAIPPAASPCPRTALGGDVRPPSPRGRGIPAPPLPAALRPILPPPPINHRSVLDKIDPSCYRDGMTSRRKATVTAKPGKLAVGYCRVSTVGQAQEGISLEAQRAKIEDWARLHDYQLIDVLVDAGLSGKRADNRPALQQALALASSRGAAVVVYKLDRLARSIRDLLAISADLQAAGADLVSLSESLDTTSAIGTFYFTLMGGLAQFERDLTSERTIAALSHKRAQGQRVGQIPYGYSLAADGVHLEAVADELRVIDQVRQLRGTGLSYHRIARHLTTAGIMARTGRAWHPQQVYNLANQRPTA